ncbi:hypothetical protein AB0D29_05790 [Streptomyces sp. NPDC048424]|uniref:hypothetical protein n=1 Tax=Streptomyces sp. NPDC048424 TaxID=3155265 RepID=UPI0034223637
MQNLARAVLVLFGVLFGLLFLLALAFGLVGGTSSPPLTEEDVTGTWEGDRGARLEVMADGRARLTHASGWNCASPASASPADGFSAEGAWVLATHSDEDPGVRIRFAVDGAAGTDGERCADWFAIRSDAQAAFLGYHGGDRETYRRTATG